MRPARQEQLLDSAIDVVKPQRIPSQLLVDQAFGDVERELLPRVPEAIDELLAQVEERLRL